MTFLALLMPLALSGQALSAIEYEAIMVDLIRPEVTV